MRLLLILVFALPLAAARWEFGSGVAFYQESATSNAILIKPGDGIFKFQHPTGQEFATTLPPEPRPSPVTARFLPISLAAAEALSGPGREAGVWHIEVCSRSDVNQAIPRAMILEANPQLRYLPDEFALALAAARTRRSPWRIAGEVLAAAGSGTAVFGLARDNRNVAAIGSGVAAILGVATQIIRPQAEAAPVYQLPNPCPAAINLAPGACFECNVLASLMRGAAPVGPVPVRLP